MQSYVIIRDNIEEQYESNFNIVRRNHWLYRFHWVVCKYFDKNSWLYELD